MDLEARVAQALKDLEDKTVWAVIVSLPTGADFHLNSGARWRVPHEHMPDRPWDVGEVSLYVCACSWVLQKEGSALLASSEIWASGDGWAEELETLIGETIVSVDVQDHARTVNIVFDGGRTITVWGNETELDNPYNGPFFSISSGKSINFLVAPDEIKPSERFAPHQLEALEVLS